MERKRRILYLHGKGGNADEALHYAALFPGDIVTGLDYRGDTPWDAGKEIHEAARSLAADGPLLLIANSIGAYFAMQAGIEKFLSGAYFISPVVDMAKLIADMMLWANVTEKELRERQMIETAFGETLSWKYLLYAREHPVVWNVPTAILYGEHDALTAPETIAAFAKAHNAALTVMPGGEHWFHTEEQMRFLDCWIKKTAFV